MERAWTRRPLQSRRQGPDRERERDACRGSPTEIAGLFLSTEGPGPIPLPGTEGMRREEEKITPRGRERTPKWKERRPRTTTGRL